MFPWCCDFKRSVQHTLFLVKKKGVLKWSIVHEFNTPQTAQTGAVTLIQRFGSALNLNIHLHMLFFDGVKSHLCCVIKLKNGTTILSI